MASASENMIDLLLTEFLPVGVLLRWRRVAEMEGKADELFHVHGLLYGMLVWSLRTREAAEERHHQEVWLINVGSVTVHMAVHTLLENCKRYS